MLLLVFVFNSNLRSNLIRPAFEDVIDTDEDVISRFLFIFSMIKSDQRCAAMLLHFGRGMSAHVYICCTSEIKQFRYYLDKGLVKEQERIKELIEASLL